MHATIYSEPFHLGRITLDDLDHWMTSDDLQKWWKAKCAVSGVHPRLMVHLTDADVPGVLIKCGLKSQGQIWRTYQPGITVKHRRLGWVRERDGSMVERYTSIVAPLWDIPRWQAQEDVQQWGRTYEAGSITFDTERIYGEMWARW